MPAKAGIQTWPQVPGLQIEVLVRVGPVAAVQREAPIVPQPACRSACGTEIRISPLGGTKESLAIGIHRADDAASVVPNPRPHLRSALDCRGSARVGRYSAVARRQPMAIMEAVWPLTMLYWGPLGLLFYFWFGRGAPQHHRDQGDHRERADVAGHIRMARRIAARAAPSEISSATGPLSRSDLRFWGQCRRKIFARLGPGLSVRNCLSIFLQSRQCAAWVFVKA